MQLILEIANSYTDYYNRYNTEPDVLFISKQIKSTLQSFDVSQMSYLRKVIIIEVTQDDSFETFVFANKRDLDWIITNNIDDLGGEIRIEKNQLPIYSGDWENEHCIKEGKKDYLLINKSLVKAYAERV